MKPIFLIFILLCCRFAFSQSIGDFQSHQSGNWNAPATWERWDGVFWINPAPGVPNTSSGAITILNNHNITVTATTSVDQLVVNSGGIILINSSRTLTIAGAGVNLAIAGTVSVGGALTTTAGATMVYSGGTLIRQQGGTINSTVSTLSFLAGAMFEHQINSPSTALSAATFDAASTLRINGFTGTGTFSSSNWDVPLGNVIYDCPNQASGTVNFAGLLRNVRGNLDIRNTGATGRVYFNSSDTSTLANDKPVNIGGSLSISGSSRVFLTSTGTAELYVSGDFLFNASVASGCATSGKGLLLVYGDAIMNSGTWDFASSSAGIGILVLNKNCSTSGASITKSGGSNANGSMNFSGSGGRQTFDPTGISSTAVSIEVNTTADVYLTNDLTIGGKLTLSAGKLILPNVTLKLNGSVYQTGGMIASDSNATPTLMIGGSGLLPVDLTIENGSVFNTIEMNRSSDTLVTSSRFTITKSLAINSGSWISADTVHFSDDATLSGTGGKSFNSISVDRNASLTSDTNMNIGGNLINNGTINLTSGTLTFTGFGTTISGDGLNTFYQTTIDSGASVNASAPVYTQSTTTVNGSFIINAGLNSAGSLTVSSTGTFICNNLPVRVIGTLTVSSGGSFVASQGADLLIDGNLSINGALNSMSTVSFAGTTTMTGTGTKLFSNVLIGGVLTPNGAYTISGDLTLSGDGILNPGNNTTTFAGANAFFTNSGTGTATFYRMTINAGAKVTANSLLIANSTFTARGIFFCNTGFTGLGAVRVSPTTGLFIVNDGPINIKGTLTVSSQATFTANANGDLTLGGNVSVTGTLNVLSTVTFNGTTTMTGSGGKFFNDVVVTGTLTPNSAYKISGDLTVNGVLNPGNNSATFPATTSFYGGGSISFNNLLIGADANVTSSSGDITIIGNLVNDGTFNHNNGSVTFSGNTSKIISSSNIGALPMDFYDIILEGGAAVLDLRTELDINLSGVLSMITAFDSARFDVDGAADNRTFTLRSVGDNPASDASVGALTSRATVAGKIVVQRYISGEGRVYRYITSPVIGASVADWQRCFPITGMFVDPSDPGVVCNKKVQPITPSLYYYDEVARNYVAFPPAGLAVSNALIPGRGYAAFIRECINPTVISVKGILADGINRGDVNLPVTHTVPVSDYNNLVGNPYPSAIQWDSVLINHVSPTIAIRDNGQGIFKYYTQGGLGAQDIAHGVIAQGQAFWTRSTAPVPSVTVRENSKTQSLPSNGNIFYRQRTPDLLEITLTGSTQAQTDKAYVLQIPGTSSLNELDDYDAPKMNNQLDDPQTELFDLYTSMGLQGKALALNALPEITCATRIMLSVKDGREGSYAFDFKRSGVFNELNVMLVDRFAGLTVNLAEENYSFSITKDTSSRALKRFELLFDEKVIDLNLPIQTRSFVCGTDPAEIKLSEPQSGIRYTVLINGHGISDTLEGGAYILFRIASNLLKEGENVASIVAIGHCNLFVLNNTARFWSYASYSAYSKNEGHCQAGMVTFHAAGAPPGWSYHWYNAPNDSVPMFSGGVFTTPELFKSHAYYVAADDSLGYCEGPRYEVVARIVNFENAKITQEEETILKSNYSTGNEWYLNEELLPDTSSRILIQNFGIYKLVVRIDTCTSQDEKMVEVTGVAQNGCVRAYPNPVSGFLYIEVEDKTNSAESVSLFNAAGIELEALKMNQTTNGKLLIDFSGYPPGIYFIRVQSGDVLYLKIIKR